MSIEDNRSFGFKIGDESNNEKTNDKIETIFYNEIPTQKKSEGIYIKGKKHGEWFYWNKDGSRLKYENYIKGNLHGTSIFYYESGKIEKEIEYVNGSKHRYVEYLEEIDPFFEPDENSPKSLILSKGTYKNDKKEGKWIDGRFEVNDSRYVYEYDRGSYKNNQRVGKWINTLIVKYIESGDLIHKDEQIGNYKDGYKDGEWNEIGCIYHKGDICRREHNKINYNFNRNSNQELEEGDKTYICQIYDRDQDIGFYLNSSKIFKMVGKMKDDDPIGKWKLTSEYKDEKGKVIIKDSKECEWDELEKEEENWLDNEIKDNYVEDSDIDSQKFPWIIFLIIIMFVLRYFFG